MSQLQVGQPSANTSGTAAGVLPNHSLSGSADQGADSSVFMLNQPATASSTNSYTELLAQLPGADGTGNTNGALTDTVLTDMLPVPVETQTDNSALAEIVTTAIAESVVLPGAISAQTDTLGVSVVDSSASVVDSSAETDADIIPDTPVLTEDPADILLNPSLLAALNFLPLPVLNQLRTEAMQQSAVGLAGFTDTDYKAAVLNSSSAYSNIKSASLPGADTALPITPMSLQHFIRQATELVRPLNHEAAAVSGIAAAQTPASTASAEPAFQWKADQLGLQSSQWGQKLVYLLSDKINLQLGQQIQRAQIRLDPPQLGLIELSVSVDGDRTTVQLYASNNQMREAMQQNLDQLRQQLAQRLGSEQLLDIDVRQQSQQQSGQQDAAPEQIAAHFADDVTELSSSTSAQLTTGWLNRLV
ncbi:flagellar hook-length control protein FliK [Rheinheimera pacifica]|uniref:flagellar hook-length control protein FliK n=1 Tax=Rheinheimera pacifica TaxID=173990 RepID=UPI002EDAB876